MNKAYRQSAGHLEELSLSRLPPTSSARKAFTASGLRVEKRDRDEAEKHTNAPERRR